MFSRETRVKGTFYEARPAHEALDVYLNSQDTLYDRVKNQQIEDLLAALTLRGKHVLEIGCGGGTWTRYLVNQGARVTVVEREPHLVEAARLYLQCNGLPLAQVEFTCGDIVDTPIAEKFDLVFAKDVIEHVREDEKFLTRLASALTPEGLLFISTQNSFCLNYIVEGLYQRYIRGQREWMGWDPTHVRFYNYQSLRALLQAQRLRPVKWLGTYHLPYRLFKLFGTKALQTVEEKAGKWLHAPERIAGDRFPLNILGWNIIVLARKDAV
jgi:2-polyprenyl-6-hydroxyphenyl methylase/3-demethylubiquinone-9 3-methyltransferase